MPHSDCTQSGCGYGEPCSISFFQSDTTSITSTPRREYMSKCGTVTESQGFNSTAEYHLPLPQAPSSSTLLPPGEKGEMLLVLEMTHRGEDHGDAVFVAGGDAVGIFDGAAGLGDGFYTSRCCCFHIIGEWEECIGCEH